MNHEFIAAILAVVILAIVANYATTLPTVALDMDGRCKWIETEAGRISCDENHMPDRYYVVRVL